MATTKPPDEEPEYQCPQCDWTGPAAAADGTPDRPLCPNCGAPLKEVKQ